MDLRLVLCDIGNTSIKIGFADSCRIFSSYAIPSFPHATADSLGFALLAAADHAGVEPGAIQAVVVASVVPALNRILKEAAERYFGCETLFVPQNLPVPLENRYLRPSEVGADRLVGAYAARIAFPEVPALIVVDFGTALTFDCVENNVYLGGLIFPGLATAAAGLSLNTARLPHVSLEADEDEPVPGRDTATSIRHGLVFGFRAVVEGLCSHLGRQLPQPLLIVATGGSAPLVNGRGKIFDFVIPNLLLDGLLALYHLGTGT